MPRNAKFICFKHRYVAKHSGMRYKNQGWKCPICQQDLFCVGDTARIPRKLDDAGWKKFKQWIMKRYHYDAEMNIYIRPRSLNVRYKMHDAHKIGKSDGK